MRWDRFFDDLEDQIDAEWEAERAALDSEAERLRISRIPLRERLVALAAHGHAAAVDLAGGAVLTGAVRTVGADWLALGGEEDAGGIALVPLSAVTGLGLPHAELLRTARDAGAGPSLRQRMSFGFVLRDLARRRVPVRVHTVGGRTRTGTIDRAGLDHFDLALHDPGEPRRLGGVEGHRIIVFDAVAWVRVEGRDGLP